MRVKYALKIHFDGSSALSYDRARPARFDYPDEYPDWWEERLALMEKLVFPCLAAQTFQDFDLWGLFSERTRKLSRTMVKAFEDIGGFTCHNGPEAIMNAYGKACDFLVLMHLDSDDIYGPEALSFIAEQDVSPGLVMYFEDGYIHGIQEGDGRLHEFVTSSRPVGPPPYFAKVFTSKALSSYKKFDAYCKKWRLHKVHHELGKCKNRVALPPWQFLGLVHGANNSRAWHNRHMLKRVGREIEGEEKTAVLEKFGL